MDLKRQINMCLFISMLSISNNSSDNAGLGSTTLGSIRDLVNYKKNYVLCFYCICRSNRNTPLWSQLSLKSHLKSQKSINIFIQAATILWGFRFPSASKHLSLSYREASCTLNISFKQTTGDELDAIHLLQQLQKYQLCIKLQGKHFEVNLFVSQFQPNQNEHEKNECGSDFQHE